jgi:hypothetical protein
MKLMGRAGLVAAEAVAGAAEVDPVATGLTAIRMVAEVPLLAAQTRAAATQAVIEPG